MPSWLSKLLDRPEGSKAVKGPAEKTYGRGGRGNVGSKLVLPEAPESGIGSSASSMFSASTTRSNNYSTGRGGSANVAPAGIIPGPKDEVASKILADRRKQLASGGETRSSARSGGIIPDKPVDAIPA